MGSPRRLRLAAVSQGPQTAAISVPVGWLATLTVAAMTVALVIAGAWADPDASAASPASQAIRAECADRVAGGLDTTMSTCLSRASEIQAGSRAQGGWLIPTLLVLASATGLLAGLVVYVSVSLLEGDRPTSRSIWGGRLIAKRQASTLRSDR